MKQTTFKLLIGNCDETFDGLLITLLKEVLQSRFELKVTKSNHLGHLSQEAGIRQFDLCLLVLNNITVPESGGNSSAKDRATWVLDFIACLKAKHRTPVIALSGDNDPWLAERATYAGVDFYFALPVEIPKLKR